MAPESAPRFVPISVDKNQWAPSPLPCQIVFVTTADRSGNPDIAPKSWVTYGAFTGSVVGFGCNVLHQTYRNITGGSGHFVINVPTSTVAALAWSMVSSNGSERVAQSGLTLEAAQKVEAPVLVESVARLECVFERHVQFGGGEVFTFGRIVYADMIADALPDQAGSIEESYRVLDPAFFLDNSRMGSQLHLTDHHSPTPHERP